MLDQAGMRIEGDTCHHDTEGQWQISGFQFVVQGGDLYGSNTGAGHGKKKATMATLTPGAHCQPFWRRKLWEAIGDHAAVCNIRLVVCGLALYLVRRDHLHISHGLGWTLAIVMSAMLGCPADFRHRRRGIGVSYAPILGVALAIATVITSPLDRH